jgi:hypothetical protein
MYDAKTHQRICQGDIFEDFVYKFTKIFDQTGEIIKTTFPYAVVLTQDCDLEWDYYKRSSSDNARATLSDDKILQSILICPAYLAEQFKLGKHLEDLGLTMNTWGGELWKNIKSNQNERFHYFEEDVNNGMPDLVIDFKHYYTVPTEDIYSIASSKCKIVVGSLFREDVSRRFANYLSRIGLPAKQLPANETLPAPLS